MKAGCVLHPDEGTVLAIASTADGRPAAATPYLVCAGCAPRAVQRAADMGQQLTLHGPATRIPPIRVAAALADNGAYVVIRLWPEGAEDQTLNFSITTEVLKNAPVTAMRVLMNGVMQKVGHALNLWLESKTSSRLTPVTYLDGRPVPATLTYCHGCWQDRKRCRVFLVDGEHRNFCATCVRRIEAGGPLYVQRAYEVGV